MTAAAPTRLGYRPELDGGRAIAVPAGLFFHLGFMAHWLWHGAQGGFLGVDLFFVLSGMLITELIVADAHNAPAASLRGFYHRRSLRLLPALVAMLAIVVSYYQLTRSSGHATLWGLWAVVTYVTTGHASHPFPAGV